MSNTTLTHTMVEGTSEPQDFQLLSDRAIIDWSEWDVEIEWRTEPGETLPEVAWLDQATGTVRVTGCEAMPVGEHLFRFKITDGAGDVAYVPNKAAADTWRVVPV
jgi:hypothetical protein